jgi:hypothetical protein
MCLTLINRYRIDSCHCNLSLEGLCLCECVCVGQCVRLMCWLFGTQVTEEQLAALFVNCGQVMEFFSSTNGFLIGWLKCWS